MSQPCGRCWRGAAAVGAIVLAVGDRGQVDFQVFADGEKATDSGNVAGADAAKHVEASLAGAQFVRLVITDGGDGMNYDHADWAGARLTCG